MTDIKNQLFGNATLKNHLLNLILQLQEADPKKWESEKHIFAKMYLDNINKEAELCNLPQLTLQPEHYNSAFNRPHTLTPLKRKFNQQTQQLNLTLSAKKNLPEAFYQKQYTVTERLQFLTVTLTNEPPASLYEILNNCCINKSDQEQTKEQQAKQLMHTIAGISRRINNIYKIRASKKSTKDPQYKLGYTQTATYLLAEYLEWIDHYICYQCFKDGNYQKCTPYNHNGQNSITQYFDIEKTFPLFNDQNDYQESLYSFKMYKHSFL